MEVAAQGRGRTVTCRDERGWTRRRTSMREVSASSLLSSTPAQIGELRTLNRRVTALQAAAFKRSPVVAQQLLGRDRALHAAGSSSVAQYRRGSGHGGRLLFGCGHAEMSRSATGLTSRPSAKQCPRSLVGVVRSSGATRQLPRLPSKPEPLRHILAGAWSRRISEEHRLVYLVDGEDLVILQARFHYK
jgi:YoeB-like toxin of bacterial type II toxin-antitoxin system